MRHLRSEVQKFHRMHWKMLCLTHRSVPASYWRLPFLQDYPLHDWSSDRRKSLHGFCKIVFCTKQLFIGDHCWHIIINSHIFPSFSTHLLHISSKSSFSLRKNLQIYLLSKANRIIITSLLDTLIRQISLCRMWEYKRKKYQNFSKKIQGGYQNGSG